MRRYQLFAVANYRILGYDIHTVWDAAGVLYLLSFERDENRCTLRCQRAQSFYSAQAVYMELVLLYMIELLKIMVLIIIKINDDICTSIDSETTFMSPAT